MKKKLTLWTQGLKQHMQTLVKNELNQNKIKNLIYY